MRLSLCTASPRNAHSAPIFSHTEESALVERQLSDYLKLFVICTLCSFSFLSESVLKFTQKHSTDQGVLFHHDTETGKQRALLNGLTIHSVTLWNLGLFFSQQNNAALHKTKSIQ